MHTHTYIHATLPSVKGESISRETGRREKTRLPEGKPYLSSRKAQRQGDYCVCTEKSVYMYVNTVIINMYVCMHACIEPADKGVEHIEHYEGRKRHGQVPR